MEPIHKPMSLLLYLLNFLSYYPLQRGTNHACWVSLKHPDSVAIPYTWSSFFFFFPFLFFTRAAHSKPIYHHYTQVLGLWLVCFTWPIFPWRPAHGKLMYHLYNLGLRSMTGLIYAVSFPYLFRKILLLRAPMWGCKPFVRGGWWAPMSAVSGSHWFLTRGYSPFS